jgi:hypothetical protein
MTRLTGLDRRLALELRSSAVTLDYRNVPDLEVTVVPSCAKTPSVGVDRCISETS